MNLDPSDILVAELQAKAKRRTSEIPNTAEDDATSGAKEQSEEKTVDGGAVESDKADDDDQSSASKSENLECSTTPKLSSIDSDGDDGNDRTEETDKEKEATCTKVAGIVIGEDNLIEIEDPDDYLMYLETILMKIHSRFYEFYDETTQVRVEFVDELASK